MEQNWVKLGYRALPKYRQGIKDFLDFAFKHTTVGDKNFCLCKQCNNYFAKTRDDVEADLLTIGILPNYTRWLRHGEERHFETCDSLDSDDESNGDGLSEMVEDYHAAFKASCVARDLSDGGIPEEPNDDAANFFQKLRANE
uniref:Transposase-associated domain-containing protein n=1 Tax=Quercus lobata TaxID=97700 RepID=A0A7N2R2F0_QUELO